MPRDRVPSRYCRRASAGRQCWWCRSPRCPRTCSASSTPGSKWGFPSSLWGRKGPPSPPLFPQRWRFPWVSPPADPGRAPRHRCVHTSPPALRPFLSLLRNIKKWLDLVLVWILYLTLSAAAQFAASLNMSSVFWLIQIQQIKGKLNLSSCFWLFLPLFTLT